MPGAQMSVNQPNTNNLLPMNCPFETHILEKIEKLSATPGNESRIIRLREILKELQEL